MIVYQTTPLVSDGDTFKAVRNFGRTTVCSNLGDSIISRILAGILWSLRIPFLNSAISEFMTTLKASGSSTSIFSPPITGTEKATNRKALKARINNFFTISFSFLSLGLFFIFIYPLKY